MTNQFELGITESSKAEKIVSETEIIGINIGDVPSRVFEIYKKLKICNVLEYLEDKTYSPKDKFVIKDRISIVDSDRVDVGGVPQYTIEIEINGTLDELYEKYEEILKEKFISLGLREDLLYALYNWDHSFSVFDENEEEINRDTALKSSFIGPLFSEGNPSMKK